MTSALILLAHGSRDPNWAKPFQMLSANLKREHPNRKIELAFMELSEPSLNTVLTGYLEQGIVEVEVLPIFFAAGRHLKEDVPKMLKTFSETRNVKVTLLGPIGEWPEFQNLLLEAINIHLKLND